MFREPHFLVFAWIVVSQATCQEKTTIKGLSRIAASHIQEWCFRQLLKASYWYSRTILWWFTMLLKNSQQQKMVFAISYLTAQSRKIWKKHPAVKKKSLNNHSPFAFSIEFVIAILHWGNYRIPIDFEIVRTKDDPKYHKPNSLARWMLIRFEPPAWAFTVIVFVDSASQKNLRLIKKSGYLYVMALARTWW